MKKYFYLFLVLLCTVCNVNKMSASVQYNTAEPTIEPHTVPFYEGFEGQHTQDEVINTWIQQSEKKYDAWVFNSEKDYNRQPNSGEWNATLLWGNTDWLFTPIRLEKGKQYRIMMFARQDGTKTEDATLEAYLCDAADMNAQKTTIMPTTGLTDGNYQYIRSDFSVDSTATYMLGIRGGCRCQSVLSVIRQHLGGGEQGV